MQDSRYFIALALPSSHQRALAKLYGEKPPREPASDPKETAPVTAASVRTRTRSAPTAGFQWTPPSQLHVTLRFIGPLDGKMLEKLVDALARIRVGPFFLPLEGVGGFPPRGVPKVIWVGVGRGHPLLFQLRQQIDDTLLALGIQADLRSFHPHVTIARIGPKAAPVAITHYLKRHRDFPGPQLHVDRFGLYHSELQPAGAVHDLVRDFPLHAS